jgi:outer membrane protein OmpA-like peptidoglycan-associated protein
MALATGVQYCYHSDCTKASTAFLREVHMFRLLRCIALIFVTALCVNLTAARAVHADVKGWEQLQWGDAIERVRQLYGHRVETPGFNEKRRLSAEVGRRVACVLRSYRLRGVGFNVYFLQDHNHTLDGIVFATDPDSFIFKEDFDSIESALKKKYGSPFRSNDHVFTNYDYYRRIWQFPSSDIELTFHFDRDAAAVALQKRQGLSTSGIYSTNISIVYFNTTKSPAAGSQAAAEAPTSGGEVIFAMTLSDDAVHFAFDRHTLTDKAQSRLDELAQRIRQSGPYRYLDIHGHTDSRGSHQYNLSLGQARADAVKQYLLERHAISPAKIRTVSHGKTKPIADNTTDAGRAQNRRVTIALMRGDAQAPAQPPMQ